MSIPRDRGGESRSKKTALLLGATGLVGNECLQLLLDDPSYNEVRVLARKPAVGHHPKLRWSVGDMDRMSALTGLFGVDDIFCCLGTTIKKAGSQAQFRKIDFEYPLEAARAAQRAGARRFLIVTSLGADPGSRVFYSRVKGEVERELRSVGVPTLAIFRPSFLLGERKESRPGERCALVLFRLCAGVFIGPLRKFRPIEARAVARAMVKAATASATGVSVFQSDQIQMLSVEPGEAGGTLL
jgi:uncharacterized protein YbjT (DUF2867 family)